MEYTLMLTGIIIASIFIVVWFLMFIKYKNQFDEMLESIDGKIFTLKDTYFIGLGLIEIYETVTKKKITAKEKAITRISKLAEIFGRDNAEFYYYITIAANISLTLTFVPVGLMIACMIGSWVGLFCGSAVAFVMIYGVNSGIKAALERKKDAIISEFPKMVSKLTLLINAGMLVRRAWDEVAVSNNDEVLYKEMRSTSKDIQDGMSIEEAMESFAARCGIKEIRKFSSLYVQVVKRGASDSIDSMKIMAEDAWEQKKQISKQKGELAAQKLMIPNMIMFLGILISVVVPMLASMLGSI